MTTYLVGQPTDPPLTVQWSQYPGGPPVDVTGLTITIKTTGGATVLAATSTGVTHVATGLDSYVWQVPADQVPGDYVAIWDGTDADSDAVQTSETFSVALAPAITVDPTTNTGMVRLLISDTNQADPLFSDAEITAFLTLGGNRVRLAAAEALDTLASNEVMVSKVIKTQDLQTDGSKVSAELRARAAVLREQDADYDDAGNLAGIQIVDFDPHRWNRWWGSGELTEPGWCP